MLVLYSNIVLKLINDILITKAIQLFTVKDDNNNLSRALAERISISTST